MGQVLVSGRLQGQAGASQGDSNRRPHASTQTHSRVRPHLPPRPCSFLCTEAAGLELEPAVELAPADRARLQKYAAATAVRWAACAAAAAAAAPASAQ